MNSESEMPIRNSESGSCEPAVASHEPPGPSGAPGSALAENAAAGPVPSGSPNPAGGPGKKQKRERCTDVTKLEPKWRELIEELLEKGFYLEDVTEILNERGGPWVTLHALALYYRNDPDLQKRRICQLIKSAEELKKKIGQPDTVEGRLADATLFTGLMRLTRRQSQLALKDAHTLRMHRQTVQLRRRVVKMREAEALRRKVDAFHRYQFEEARRQKLVLENQRLMEIIKKLRQDQTLPPDVMSKIQEIYGIVKEPYIAPRFAEQLSQDATP